MLDSRDIAWNACCRKSCIVELCMEFFLSGFLRKKQSRLSCKSLVWYFRMSCGLCLDLVLHLALQFRDWLEIWLCIPQGRSVWYLLDQYVPTIPGVLFVEFQLIFAVIIQNLLNSNDENFILDMDTYTKELQEKDEILWKKCLLFCLLDKKIVMIATISALGVTSYMNSDYVTEILKQG